MKLKPNLKEKQAKKFKQKFKIIIRAPMPGAFYVAINKFKICYIKVLTN